MEIDELLENVQGIERRDPQELEPHPKNPREHPDKLIEKLKDSITNFGFNTPVIINTEDTILAGHARRRAAIDLDLEDIPCVVVELEGELADAYLIADNRHPEDRRWEPEFLEQIVNKVDEEVESLEVEFMGLEDWEIETLDLDFSVNDYFDNVDKAEEITCQHCGHTFVP